MLKEQPGKQKERCDNFQNAKPAKSKEEPKELKESQPQGPKESKECKEAERQHASEQGRSQGPSRLSSTSCSSPKPQEEQWQDEELEGEEEKKRKEILVAEVERIMQIKKVRDRYDWIEILRLESGFDDRDVERKKRDLFRIIHPDKSKKYAKHAGGEERCKTAYEFADQAYADAKQYLELKRRGQIPPWESPRFPTPSASTQFSRSRSHSRPPSASWKSSPATPPQGYRTPPQHRSPERPAESYVCVWRKCSCQNIAAMLSAASLLDHWGSIWMNEWDVSLRW